MKKQHKIQDVPRQPVVADKKILIGITSDLNDRITISARESGLSKSAFIRMKMSEAVK